MARTPLEMANARERDARMFLEAAENALHDRDFYLLADNLTLALGANLARGLILWRHGLGDPRPPLLDVLMVAQHAETMLAGFAGTVVWKHFDPTPVSFVSYLVTGKRERLSLESCGLENWKEDGRAHVRQALDAALVSVIDRDGVPPLWDRVVADLQGRRRERLLKSTYENYMALVLAANTGDRQAIRDAMGRGAELFRERARSGFYEPSDSDGGGPFNTHVVDYRLAAIIKMKTPGLQSEQMSQGFPHVWRW